MFLIDALAIGCNGGGSGSHGAIRSITVADLARHIEILASDEFEGRAPGTRGERLTVQYLVEQLRGAGLKPGNSDGTYVQTVPLVSIQSRPTASLSVKGRRWDLRPVEDFVAVSRRLVPEVRVQNSAVVFVGYGVVAPEYGWDDYKGMDVRGKTILMLSGDPPVADPKEPSRLDEAMFKGRAMTYYGTLAYKVEIASAKGAAAVLVVLSSSSGQKSSSAAHQPSRTPAVVTFENLDLQRADRNIRRIPIEGTIDPDTVKKAFLACGRDFESLGKAAAQKDFHPAALPVKGTFVVNNTLREFRSSNLIANLEGSDPAFKDEYVMYVAHWDHLGRDNTLKGDRIFNGALDNASGVSALLELAKAYSLIPERPKRSVLFFFPTAEEAGRFGSQYYAENPPFPLTKTIAVINIDGVDPWGRTKDVAVIGMGNSTIEDIVKEAAREGQRELRPDVEPESGLYYRSDHFEFARRGVPALHLGMGTQVLDKPPNYGMQRRSEYEQNDYHRVSDEIKPDWDLSGAVEDTRLLFEVGYRVAQGRMRPQWKPGSERESLRPPDSRPIH